MGWPRAPSAHAWTEEQRRIYRREGDGYPSDLRDAEWDAAGADDPGGRPRKTDMRAAMNAILYLLRTGCPWRYLPRDGFPPRSTVATQHPFGSGSQATALAGLGRNTASPRDAEIVALKAANATEAPHETDIVTLSVFAQATHGHVFEHTSAQWAYGLMDGHLVFSLS